MKSKTMKRLTCPLLLLFLVLDCELSSRRDVVAENAAAYARYDSNSLAPGHVDRGAAPARGRLLRHDRRRAGGGAQTA